MRLVRYGRAGAEKPGLIDEDGAVRDLSRAVEDITPDLLSPAGQRRLRATRTARLPLVRGRPRLGAPLSGIGKIVCIGLNYTDHAREVGLPLPTERATPRPSCCGRRSTANHASAAAPPT